MIGRVDYCTLSFNTNLEGNINKFQKEWKSTFSIAHKILLFGAIKIKYKVYIIAETTVLNYKPLSLLLFHYGGLYDM